jgi:hypothetical protein
VYGDLQGIAGNPLEEIDGFALPLLVQAGGDDTFAA